MSPTQEQLDDIRKDAEFTRDRVGAPGSPIRARAVATLAVLDIAERSIATVKAIRLVQRDALSAMQLGGVSADETGVGEAVADLIDQFVAAVAS